MQKVHSHAGWVLQSMFTFQTDNYLVKTKTILPLRRLLSLEWRSSLSLLTRVKMQCSPTWRSLMATGLLSAITQTWRRSWTRSSRCKNWPWPWPWPWRAQLYAYVYIQVEGIPTLVVVTKEGKLVTDQGDEQVLNRKICFYYFQIYLFLDGNTECFFRWPPWSRQKQLVPGSRWQTNPKSPGLSPEYFHLNFHLWSFTWLYSETPAFLFLLLDSDHK